MDQENPTAGDSGASTHDRIERFLAAAEAPEPATRPEPNTSEAQPAEPEDAAEKKVEESAGDAPQEDEGPQITTADLAKILGIDETLLDVSDDGAVQLKTKIDGKEGAAKLADFLKSYQLQGHIDNKSRAIAEQEKAVQARAAEVEQAAAARMQQIEDLAGVALSDLMQQYNSIDWQTLRATNPAEYAAAQHDFQSRHQQIHTRLQQIQQQRAETQQKSQQTLMQQMQERIAEQSAKLVEKIPEWADADKAKAGKAEVASYLQAQGFAPEELAQASDHRAIVLAHKAMLYDKLQQNKAAVEKQVRAAPKIVKPGQAQTQSREAQSIRNIKTQIRASGGKQGIVDYLLATGKA